MARPARVKHEAIGVERVQLACRFYTNGSSNPATVYGQGVASVVHTATGKWTITFQESVKRVVGLSTTLGLATPGDQILSAQIDNEGTTSALQVVVNLFDISGAALADLAANADNWISVVVEAEQSVAGV